MDVGSCHCTGDRDQDHPHGKEMQKTKWLSEEALQIAVKRREVKSKGEKERYKHLMRVETVKLKWVLGGDILSEASFSHFFHFHHSFILYT